jgi:hypothetical protein
MIRGVGMHRQLAAALILALAIAACSLGPGSTVDLYVEVSPTPTPTLTPANAAVKTFVDTVLAGKMTYHADFTGSAHSAGNIIEMSGSMDAAGHDYQIAAAYEFPGEGTGRYANRLVGDIAWVRPDGGAWQKDTSFDPAQPNGLFSFINDDDDVKFVKTETVGGKTFHRVRFEKSQLITPRQFPAGNVTQERVVRSWVELLLDAKGVPVNAHWRLEGRGRVSGQLQELIIQADLTFSKVGAAMTIKAP